MVRMGLLLLILTLSTVFLFIPDTGPDRFKKYIHEGKEIIIDTSLLPEDSEKQFFFPFSSVKLFLDTYVFLLIFHLCEVLYAVYIVIQEKEFPVCAKVFLCIICSDTLFYLLSYGEPLRDYNLTWNVIKIGGFIISIVLSIWKPLRTNSVT